MGRLKKQNLACRLIALLLGFFIIEHVHALCYMGGKSFSGESACNSALRTANQQYRSAGGTGNSGLSCRCTSSDSGSSSSGSNRRRESRRAYMAEQEEALRRAEEESRSKALELERQQQFEVDKQETLKHLKSLDGDMLFDGRQRSSSSSSGLKRLTDEPVDNESSMTTSGLKSISTSNTSSNKETGGISVSCSSALVEVNKDIDRFVNEAEQKGYDFAKKEYTKTLKAMGEDKLLKVTKTEYGNFYKGTKKTIDFQKQTRNDLKQLTVCANNTNCNLLVLSKRLNKELYDWLKGFSAKGIQKASDRVKEAGEFYSGYVDKLVQNNQSNLSAAAECL